MTDTPPTAAELRGAADILERIEHLEEIPGYSPDEPWTAAALRKVADAADERAAAEAEHVRELARWLAAVLLERNSNTMSPTWLAQQLRAEWTIERR